MKEHCKLSLNQLNRIVPTMPDGQPIPGIVKDSVEVSFTPDELKAGVVRIKLELFVPAIELNSIPTH